MKKIMLLSLIGMIFLSESTFATITELFANPGPPSVWIKITLNFHRPSTNCETGFGICVDISAGVDGMGRPATKSCPVLMKINDQNQLLIQVTEDDLRFYENGTTLPYFKDKTTITLGDSYTFTPETCKNLGTLNPVVIRPGTYPLNTMNNTYTITIPL